MDLVGFQTFRVGVADLNGQMRGKRMPGSYASSLEKDGIRMPYSALNLDIFGADIEDSPLVFESGDMDGVLRPTERGPVPLPWLTVPQPLVPMSMYTDDGARFEGDPRHALLAVLERFSARGWKVVAATELEFTLVDDSGSTLQPVRSPRTGYPVSKANILSLSHLDAFDEFFSDLYEASEAMGIPAQTTTSEAGLGQFEVTLHHQEALRAADDTWLLKYLIKGLARKHGFAATFMAKPFVTDSGNGMHVHFSVLDEEGRNVFDNGGPEGSDLLKSALAGCLEGMAGGTLVFAPHANSYLRLRPGAHAPTTACWAYENRTTALRVPGGSAAARRIEHRVPGGDINPYLTFAAILGSAMYGIDHALTPAAPVTGNAYDLDLPPIAAGWKSAIDQFETCPVMAEVFAPMLRQNLLMTKRQELSHMSAYSPEEEWRVYLETV